MKIVFDEPLPAGRVLGPGLSVMPSVQTSKFVFPAWAVALIAVVITVSAVVVFRFFAGGKPAAN